MTLLRKISLLTLGLMLAIGLAYLYQSQRVPRHWDASLPAQNKLTVLKRAAYYIQNNYVAPDQLDAMEMLRQSLHALQQGLAPVMVQWDEQELTMNVAGQTRRFLVPEQLALDDLPNFLGHVVDFLQAHLPDNSEDLHEDNHQYLLIGGVVSALDPHSSFLRPKIYSEFKIGTTGNFGGVGIAIGIRDGYLTVIAPLEGTPAFRAGLKAQDSIFQIDDERTINMSLTEAVERLRGKIGTTVTMLIRRENVPDLLSFTLRRALITIDSVKAELLPEEKIALVRIKNFQEDTATEFHQAMRKLTKRAGQLSGLILDMRNNPGGLLDQSVALADDFLSDGVIVSTVGLSNQLHEEERARAGDLYENIPVVVLVNEGSASASEILAGALQVHKRAIVLGNRTFGKGTVQTLYDLKDGSALKLTIAKYLAAGTEDVQAFGIVPDVLMTPLKVSDDSIDLVENQTRREHDLEKRIEHNGQTTERESAAKLSYLEFTEKAENIAGTVQIVRDYPVALAKRILAKQQAPTRTAQLAILEEISKELAAEQEMQLTTALAEQNIDWSVGPTGEQATAQITTWFTHEDKKIESLQGGQDVTMHLEVKNTGNTPYYRLLAITDSENPLLSDLEFPLGRIEPGESQEYAVPITLPASVPSQRIPINITFQEHYDRTPPEQTIPVAIQERDDPHFVYSWTFRDPQKPLAPDETIDLVFHIANVGAGTANEPVLNLANREGSHVFLKTGRAKLDPIAPRNMQKATLSIQLKDGVPLSEARMAVLIEDRETGYVLRDTLTLADNATAYSPPMQAKQSPPQITLQLPEDAYWSDAKKYRFSGQVKDDGPIKEIYVFVNVDKIYYQAVAEDATNPVPFDVTIPLEPGANRINVLTKDRENLLTRKRWIVWKPKE